MTGKEKENKENNDVWLPTHYPQGAHFLQKINKKKKILIKSQRQSTSIEGIVIGRGSRQRVRQITQTDEIKNRYSHS